MQSLNAHPDNGSNLDNVLLLLVVRTALVALIAFMPTNPNGALGSLDYKKEERRALAIKSREAAPTFGNPERQKLIDEVDIVVFPPLHVSSLFPSLGLMKIITDS